MNILYIHQYFKTPKEPGGTRSYWISKELIKSGHNVTVLTTSSSISNKIERVNIEGINVIYLKIPYNQKMSILKRIYSFAKFMLKSTLVATKLKEIDLTIATSTPLTVGFPALFLKKIKKIPYIFEVRDLWPEVPIQMGAIRNKIVINFLVWFEKTIYKNANHIIALSPGMKEGVIEKLKSDSNVSMIPNMAKIDEFRPKIKAKEDYLKYKLNPKTFKVIHFGALGLANGAEYIIEAAKENKNDNSIEFIFIGHGSTEEKLIKICSEFELKNVHFLGAFSMNDTSNIVNLCDVSLVSFANIPILYTNSPNKLFDSLSAGKPIIVNSPGWTKDLIEKENCGFYADVNNPKSLIEKINLLKNDPELLNMFSINSRKLAESTFDKSILTQKVCDIVQNIKKK